MPSAAANFVPLPRSDLMYSLKFIGRHFSLSESNNQAQANTADAKFRRMDMLEIAQRRKARLRQLIDSPKFGGNQLGLSEITGKSLSQIGQWLSGNRNMGERSAREIEQKLRLPANYFDNEDVSLPVMHAVHEPGIGDDYERSILAEQIAELADYFSHCPPKERANLIALAKRWAEQDRSKTNAAR